MTAPLSMCQLQLKPGAETFADNLSYCTVLPRGVIKEHERVHLQEIDVTVCPDAIIRHVDFSDPPKHKTVAVQVDDLSDLALQVHRALFHEGSIFQGSMENGETALFGFLHVCPGLDAAEINLPVLRRGRYIH